MLLFVKKNQLSGNTLSEDEICAKAKLLFEDLIKKDFIILARKSFIEMKYNSFLLILVYDMLQYTVQFVPSKTIGRK